MRTTGPRRALHACLLAPAAALTLAFGAPALASAADGPRLSVPRADLAHAVRCNGRMRDGREPVILVPGTTVTPKVEYSWSWIPALRRKGWPFCTVELPGSAMGDIQIAAEYVVHAIRAAHARSGQRVQIVGHSQGGMVPRWALKYWPDTRALVDDMVGMAPSNHGTTTAQGTCTPDCAPAIWQQRDNSAFMGALNAGRETYPGISYTVVYTHTDEVVMPNSDSSGSSSLHGGGGQIANIAIQDICPLDTTEHLGLGTYDNTAYHIVMDALTHSGPASAARIKPSVCDSQLHPGVNPATFATDYGAAGLYLATVLATYPHVPAEPALRCYVSHSCP
jgi:triacylglycerol esterase/lipase EstA (alpha/beta hydrolase family)